MNRNIIVFLFLIFSFSLYAQSVADALRFSQSVPTVTARNMAVGGTLGALGGDFSTVHSNPAGLAVYRSSEFAFTPTLFTDRTDATLIDADGSEILDESERNFNLNNIGIVLFHRPRSLRWKTANIAIGFSRLNNFNQEFSYAGTTNGSITDRFLDLVQGTFPEDLDDFEAGIAWDTGAIYPDSAQGLPFYQNDFIEGGGVDREENVKTAGAMNELTFAFAGNYQEKLMIGVTIGIPFLRYEQERVYQESDDGDQIPFFNDLTYIETLTTEGTGVNLKLGLIYRINQMVRLGMAFHTPTVFAVTDRFSTELQYSFTDANGPSISPFIDSPIQTFDYRISTPWRILGNAGFIIGRKGFISAELEWVDYAATSFNLTATANNDINRDNERFLNNEIEDVAQSAISFRVGGEFVLSEIFRLRGGLGVTQSPFAQDEDAILAYSFGVGVRDDGYYIDLGYRGAAQDETFVPYFVGDQAGQVVDLNRVTNRIALSVGFTF